MKISVTQNGKPLANSKYNWDEKTKTFSTNENDLVLDFSECDGVTFNTGSDCTFKTGSDCTFKTGSCCTFNTGYGCTFKTGYGCTFKTGSDCTFNTDYGCTFNTGSDCTFKTGPDCTFKTGYGCTFNTGYGCTFNTGENCFVTRWDVKGCDEIIVSKTIKLNGSGIKGYTIIEEVKEVKEETCNGTIVEVNGKKYKLLLQE